MHACMYAWERRSRMPSLRLASPRLAGLHRLKGHRAAPIEARHGERKERVRGEKMASFSPDQKYPISLQQPSPNFTGAAAAAAEEDSSNALEFQSEQDPGMPFEKKDPWLKKKKKNQVLLEGYVATDGSNDPIVQDQQLGMMSRTKSLTDGDLDELKGCVDLGFGFSYEEIPELCNTLPALELCYSMSQKFLDEQQQQQKSPDGADSVVCSATSSAVSPIANWRISAPGDHPEDVKARLKFWAQAVACTVRLCS